MKVLPLFVILIIIFGIEMSAQNGSQMVVAPIGFYNLENLFDTINDTTINDEDFLPDGDYHYNSDVYNSKLRNLSDVIALLGTEVNSDGVALLGVSEVENKAVLKDLVKQEKLAGRRLKIVHFDSHDFRGIDCALIYNPKYFKVLSAKPLYMYLDGKEYITRSVLWVTGSLLGEKVHVFVNHWPSRRGGEAATAHLRKAAAGIDRHIIDSLIQVDTSSRFIVMGDLNDDPTNASVTEVLGAIGDIEEVKNPRDMYNPYYSFYKKGMGTTAYRDAWSLFDQIIVGKDIAKPSDGGWEFLNAEVFQRNFMMQKFGHFKGYPLRSFSYGKWLDGYSDHFPVVVYLSKMMKLD